MERKYVQTPFSSLPPHVVIYPSPGMGHLIPLAEFAKQLVLRHNISVTFIIPTDDSPTKPMISVLDDLPEGIDYKFLPKEDLKDQPKDAKVETLIDLTMQRSLYGLWLELGKIIDRKGFVLLVVDLFGTEAQDVADLFNIPFYIFFPTTAMCLLLFFNLAHLHQKYSCEYRDIPEPIKLPGCVPIPGSELWSAIQDRKNQVYGKMLGLANRHRYADGIFINSFPDMEPGAIRALMDRKGWPLVCPIGPLIQRGLTNRVDEYGCLKWLDNQPHGSVLFVSFGSGGTLSYEQTTELAYGLEMSGQRFIWVVKSPNTTPSGSYFTHITNDPFHFLPDGFVERTNGSGLLVPSWAPQIQILGHGSTGGFLTHCGWNSTLESTVNGVPMITWPLFAEQKMNAILLVEDLGVALRPKANESGLIEREEIARVVTILIEGEEGNAARKKIGELKEAAATVLSDDGSSTKAIAKIAEAWKENKFSI